MDNIRILERSGKIWFSSVEISSLLGLSFQACAVFCSRAVSRGDLIRAKRGIFVLPRGFKTASENEIFALSNILQTPSYISLTSALSALGVSTQIVRSACEAISPVRSSSYEIGGIMFTYACFSRKLFCGFERRDGVFMATPEKAFADAAYLTSLGRYSLDLSALNLSLLKRDRIDYFLKKYTPRTRRYIEKIMGAE